MSMPTFDETFSTVYSRNLLKSALCHFLFQCEACAPVMQNETFYVEMGC